MSIPGLEAAAEYSDRHRAQALFVRARGKTLFARYAAGCDAVTPHALYSGTKSFWGVAALRAQEDGLLSLDERVAQTFPAWESEAYKRRVTLRHLLSLTAGIGFGGLGNAVPSHERALATEVRNPPGERFTYGGIALQIFGAVFAQKLASRNQTPYDYLRERVLEPAGVQVARWRTLADGTQPSPTGAFLTARDWAAYGAYVIENAVSLRECFAGSNANPRYGLCWWLAPAYGDVFYASGSGGQAMYLSPSRALLVVRFGASSSFKHDAFLKRLLPS